MAASIWDYQEHYADLLAMAGFEQNDTPTVWQLLERLKHRIYFRTGETPGGVAGYTDHYRGRTRITLRPFLGVLGRIATASHELSETFFEWAGYRKDPDREQASDLLGLYIQAPRQSVLRVSAQRFPSDFTRVARAFEITELEAAFRVAEERYLPLVALRRSDVLYAGPPFEWGPTDELKALAKRLVEGTLFHPLIRAARARDERSLTFMWAE